MPITSKPNSKEFIRDIKKKPEDFYIIHYSCESLDDRNSGLAPRITSIAVFHVATQQTKSFSTHLIAEELGVSREDIEPRLDDIEKELLEKFSCFLTGERQNKNWIHWNMRNSAFGFEHLAHRYRVLNKKDMNNISMERRINLSDILQDRYGSNYVKDPKMPNLMELNGTPRHFLSGSDEVKLFTEKKYFELHLSTLSKVGFFYKTIDKMLSGKLETDAKNFGLLVDRILDSRGAKMITLFATVLSILVAIGGWLSFFLK